MEENTQTTTQENQEEFYYDEIGNDSISSLVDAQAQEVEAQKSIVEDEEDGEDREVEETEENTEEETADAVQEESPEVKALKEEIASLKEDFEKRLADASTKREEDLNKAVDRAMGKEEVDESKKFRQDVINEIPFIKEKRDPENWLEGIDQILDAVEKVSSRVADEKLKQRDLQASEQAQQAKQKEAEYNQAWNDQLTRLETDGHLPKLTPELQEKWEKGTLNEDEKKLPAVSQRMKLFKSAADEMTLNKDAYKGGNIPNLEFVYHKYVKGTTKQQPEGAKVIVSKGAKPAVNTQDNQEFYYDEIPTYDPYAL